MLEDPEVQDVITPYEMGEDYDQATSKQVMYSTSPEEQQSGIVTASFANGEMQTCGGVVVGSEMVLTHALCIYHQNVLAEEITFDPGITEIVPHFHREYAHGAWITHHQLARASAGAKGAGYEDLANGFALLYLPAIKGRPSVGEMVGVRVMNYGTDGIQPGHTIELNGYSYDSNDVVSLWESLCHVSQRIDNPHLVFETDCDPRHALMGSGIFDDSPSSNKELFALSIAMGGAVRGILISKEYLNSMNELIQKKLVKNSLFKFEEVTRKPVNRVFFQNECSTKIGVAVRYGFDGEVVTEGWYEVPAHSAAYVVNMTTNTMHYVAAAFDGSKNWLGDEFYTLNGTSINQEVGMIRHTLDDGWRDSIVTLSCD